MDPHCRAMLAAAAAALLLAATAASAAGEWIVVEDPDTERLCGELSLCTASNLTWSGDTTYDKDSGCALLKRKGLENLHFFGDR